MAAVNSWSVWQGRGPGHGLAARLFADHNEGEQLVARILWGVVIPLWMLATTTEAARRIFLTFAVPAHFLSMLGLALWMLLRAGPNPARRYVAMASDAFFVTLYTWQTGEAGAFIASIGLFITIGYGFRYGLPYMLTCAALVLIGNLALLFDPFWRQHHWLWAALPSFTLVALPYLVLFLKRADRLTSSLQRASDEKSRILSVISHNLRTPVGAIMANLHLAQGEPRRPIREGYLDAASAAAGMLLRQIQNSLTLAIVDQSGAGFTTPETVVVRDFVGELFQLARAKATDKGLDSCLVIDPEVPEAAVIASLAAREALIALLDNAVKFTHTGSIELTISVGGGSSLLVEVRDSGVGISTEDLPHVFDRFWQRDMRAGAGSGLGTSIARELIAAVGGTVGVQSALHRGSVFWFTLPFRLSKAPEPTLVPSTAGPLQILVAEDDPAMAEVVRRILVRHHHVVTTVDNGRDALSQLAKGGFQIAILDQHMPGLLGTEVMAGLRGCMKPEVLPRFFMLSADTTPDAIARAYEMGADAFIAKPVTEDQLLSTLKIAATVEGTVTGVDPDILPIAHESMRLSLERAREALRASNPLDAREWIHRAKGTARVVRADTLANRITDLQTQLSDVNATERVTVADVSELEAMLAGFMARQQPRR